MKSSFKISGNHSEWKDKKHAIMRTDIKKNIEIIKREFDGCIFMKATLHGIKIGGIALTRNDGENIKLADIIINEDYRGCWSRERSFNKSDRISIITRGKENLRCHVRRY